VAVDKSEGVAKRRSILATRACASRCSSERLRTRTLHPSNRKGGVCRGLTRRNVAPPAIDSTPAKPRQHYFLRCCTAIPRESDCPASGDTRRVL